MKDIDRLKKEISQIILGSPAVKKIPTSTFLPSTDPEIIIEEVLTRRTGPIVDEEDYIGRKNRLSFLEKWLPMLSGDKRKRAELAINILKQRMEEYEKEDVRFLIAKASDFLERGILSDEDFGYAEHLINLLEKKKGEMTGYWEATLESYISKLRDVTSEYYEKRKAETEGKQMLGEPEVIPEWVKGFASQPLFYSNWFRRERGKEVENPVHPVESEYCKVQTVKEGEEYLLGFEDRDEKMYKEGYPYAPDWDYDEPLVRVKRDGNKITVTIEKYGGLGISRLTYFGNVIFDPIGGIFKTNVGKTKVLVIPEEVAPPPTPPTPPAKPPEEEKKPTVWDKIKGFLPWGVAIGALGIGGAALLKKK